MEQKELRGEINRVLVIIAGVVVVLFVGWAILAASEEQRRREEADYQSRQGYIKAIGALENAQRCGPNVLC